jgi:anthranilate/para-aminobenzoate synthase component II
VHGKVHPIRHSEEGIQFHPEAVLTEGGLNLMKDFLNLSRHIQEENNAQQND